MEFQTDKVSFLYLQDTNWITLRVEDKRLFTQASALEEGLYDVTIKKHRKKRSLNANAYCWLLLDKLSEKLNIPAAELYRETIRNIGGVSDMITIKFEALDRFCRDWTSRGLGYQVIAESTAIAGWVDCQCFYGSSTYDTAQMSRLIDLIVEECKVQGIETMTPEQIEDLKSKWSEYEKHRTN